MNCEWTIKTWGELATLEYGRALSGYRAGSGKYRVFGTNGPIGWTERALYPGPSVIIGRKGAYRGVHFSPEPFWAIDTAFYLKPKLSFNMKWAYYALLAQDINSLDSGSAIPSTSRSDFYALSVKVPPINEQRRIADVLGLLDARRETLVAENGTLESIAQAVFKSWFIDFDPVHAKAAGREPMGMDAETAALFPNEFEDSELGPIPIGWKVRSLDSIAVYTNGLALQKFPPESDTNFLPVIKIAQMRAGHTDGADKASNRLEPQYIVENGDVLFSWSGSLEVEIWTGGRGALNQHIFKVTSNEAPKWYYYLATKHFLPRFRNIAASKATTMGHIRRRDLAEAKLAVPPVEVLPKLGQTIEVILERRILNALKARTLAELRDALLPRLISGKLRIPEAEELVEEAVS